MDNGKLTLTCQQEKVQKLLEAGGKLHRTTNIADYLPESYFYPPSIITDCPHDAVLEIEEIFGPVATLHTFQTDAQAVEMANEANGMLTAFVFSGSKESGLTLASAVEAGMVMVNGVGFGFEMDPDVGDEEPALSFWGRHSRF